MRAAFILVVTSFALAASAAGQVVADFTADKTLGVLPMFVQFTNLSTYPAGTTPEFLWDFGDGTFGVGKNPSHLYETDGVFTVSLAVHVGGQASTKTRQGYIRAHDLTPQFEGSPRVLSPPFSVSFTNQTSTIGSIATSFLWDFGDGSTSTAVNPTHTYIAAGKFNVSLHATAESHSRTTTKVAYILSEFPEPDFLATRRSGTAPLTVTFSNLTEPAEIIQSYHWEFGDGSTSSETHPLHTYQSPGVYTVGLSATTFNGITRLVSKPLLIRVFDESEPADAEIGGYEYLVAFPEGFANPIPRLMIVSYEQANVIIDFPGPNFRRNLTMSANTAIPLDLPWDVIVREGDVVTDQGGLIVSDGRIQVYGLILEHWSSDGYAAIPIDSLGTRYRVITTPASEGHWSSQFTVVALQNATTIDIRPTVTIGAHQAGEFYSVNLNALEVYQQQTDDKGEDLSGTMILSNKPVAVFGGNECTKILGEACDTVVEQIPPVSAWGLDHIVVSLASRGSNPGDFVRVLAHLDSTDVSISGPQSESFVLDAGESATRTLVGINRITSSKPVLIAQVATGATFQGGKEGDPFMMLVVPTNDFGINYTIRTPRPIEYSRYRNFVNLVVDSIDVTEGTIRIDEVSIKPSLFSPVPDTIYSAARIALDPGTHTFSATSPFGLYSYGFQEWESYGYSGGRKPPPQIELANWDLIIALRESFNELDSDGDGNLTIAEAALDEEKFSAIDLDHDGRVTMEELLMLSIGSVGIATPVYVDFNRSNAGRGTLMEPFHLFHEAQVFVKPGGSIRILDGYSPETFVGAKRLRKPISIRSEHGSLISIGGTP